MEGMLNLVKQRESGVLRSVWREIEWRPKAVTIVTRLNEIVISSVRAAVLTGTSLGLLGDAQCSLEWGRDRAR